MKNTGFKRLSYAEALEKKKAQDQKRLSKRFVPKGEKKAKPPKKKKVKHPTILGVKSSRYVGIKGCLWTIFSIYIRKRDFVKYGGRCISCPTILTDWKLGDAGHYVSVSRGNFETLFDEKNVHLQCKRCNNPEWTPDASIPMAIEIDRRLGKGTAEDIYRRSQRTGQGYSEAEYLREIATFKERSDKIGVS